MTRSEAIEKLIALRNFYAIRQFGQENTEALDLAINSLSVDEAYQLEYENRNSLFNDLKQGLQEAIEYEQTGGCDG